MSSNGVFCIEGQWETDLRKRDSVLPVIDLLERLDAIKAVHRTAATVSELTHYLGLWRQSRYNDYLVLYLATHGDDGVLQWSREEQTTLDNLADVLGDTARGCYVHLGSCLTLFSDDDARAFVKKTGVSALLGYRAEVDWVESAAFEAIMLSCLAEHATTTSRAKTFYKDLMNRHAALAQLLEFVMVTPRQILDSHDFVG